MALTKSGEATRLRRFLENPDARKGVVAWNPVTPLLGPNGDPYTFEQLVAAVQAALDPPAPEPRQTLDQHGNPTTPPRSLLVMHGRAA